LACDPATQRQAPACDRFDEEEEPACVCGPPPAATGCACECNAGYVSTGAGCYGFVEHIGFMKQMQLPEGPKARSAQRCENVVVVVAIQDETLFMCGGQLWRGDSAVINLTASLGIEDYRFDIRVTDMTPANNKNGVWIAFTFSGLCGAGLEQHDTGCSAVELVSFAADFSSMAINSRWGKNVPW
jgi:hypothetical protein